MKLNETMRKKGFLKIKDVAKYLQLGERTVYRYIKTKKLKATRIGGWRITKDDLQDFIKRSTNL